MSEETNIINAIAEKEESNLRKFNKVKKKHNKERKKKILILRI